jgi:hypothetical protein
MPVRVSHLESRMERVETKLDTIIERLGGIATKSDMRDYLFVALGLVIALIAVLVTAMGWLETRAARVQPTSVQQPPAPTAQPIIIQVPYPPQGRRH